MVRKLFGVLAVALVLCLGAVLADEFMGQVTKIDTKAMKITVSVDGKDKEVSYNKETSFMRAGRKGGDPTKITADDIQTALDKAKDNPKAKVNAKVKTNDKGVATEVQLGGGRRGGGGGGDQ